MPRKKKTSNQNQKPLQEGTEKKGGMNNPPKNSKPNIQPSGQKSQQPKAKSKFKLDTKDKYTCPVHKKQEAVLHVNDGNRDKSFCLACVMDGLIELGCFEVKKLLNK